MSSSDEIAHYLHEQAGEEITLRKMFGEYAVKIGEKTVGLLCNDQLFIRILPETTAALSEDTPTGEPYPGAKPWYQLSPDLWEERDFLRDLLRTVETALPAPKAKKARSKKPTVQGELPPDMPPELL